MKLFSAILFASAVVFASSQVANAGTQELLNVTIDKVAVLGDTTYGAHIPGNLEIRIHNGFTPVTVSCPGNQATLYITTKRSFDLDRAMLNMLQAAVIAHRTVDLLITDAPANTAWPGRCSLLAAGVLW